MSGKLIVFEGVDATGKTTLCDVACGFLETNGFPVKRYTFPGNDEKTLGGLVYKIHHHYKDEFGINNINNCSLQLLHVSAHIDLIESSIKKSIIDGEYVVLDRFWWSTYVYGLDGGIDENRLQLMINLEKTFWGKYTPDVIFLIESQQPLRDDVKSDYRWRNKVNIYNALANRERKFFNVVKVCTEIDQQEKAFATIVSELMKI